MSSIATENATTSRIPRGKRKPVDWRTNRDRMDGMSLGIEMGASVVLGWYLGKLFDDHFATAPWGMVFFLLAGLGAASKAVLRFYRQAKRVMAKPESGEAVAAEMDRARETGGQR